MKKLMTMMSAVAAAFGLYATEPSPTGTSFEGIVISEGDSVPYDSGTSVGELIAQEAGQSYWSNVTDNASATLTVMAGTSRTGLIPGSGNNWRPKSYLDNSSSQQRYLSVKTTLGNPVTRNINVDGSSVDIGSAYYFDSLVKFTAFDVENEASAVVTNNGKLAIWLKEELALQNGEEVPVKTNLIVTAGFLNESLGAGVVPTNYVCSVRGVDLNDGAWHRVTVKAVENIYKEGALHNDTPGFMVFIDGQDVICSAKGIGKGIDTTALIGDYKVFDNEGALFPSALQTTTAKKKLVSVSFDGQGDVDDLVFTTEPPEFDVSTDKFTISLGTGVASATYTDGTNTKTITDDETIDLTDGLTVRITSIVAEAGYTVYGYEDDDYVALIQDTDGIKDDESVPGEVWYTPTENGQSITLTAVPATIKVGIGAESEWFETLSDAFGYVNDQVAGGDFTVELTAVATDGFVLNNANATVTLDLAGNDITNATKSAAVVLQSGSLLITNSTPETVGHVVAMTEGGDAVLASGGELAIAGGKYDGFVFYDYVGVPPFEITDGEFAAVNGEDSDVLDQLVTAVKEGLGDDYTLSLDGDYYVIAEDTGWTVTFMDGESEYDSQRVEDGELADVPDAPTKDGYEFNGWYEEGAAVPFNFATAITNNLTLYADWTLETYNITYNLDLEGATNAVANVSTYTYNDAVVILPAGCVGYTFNGWTNSEGQVVSAIALHSTDDVTLYASWTADTYNITYLNDDGTPFTDWADNYAAPATYTVARDVTLPTSTDVKLDVVGAEFKGWTNETGTVTGWLAGEKTGDVTVYAKIEGSGAPTIITPGTGVTSVEVAASGEADAISKVTIVPPTGSGIDTAEEEAAYLALLDITAEEVSGKEGYYEVTINGIKPTVVTAVDADAVAVFSGDTSVTIPQGLYYRITPSTSLPIPASVEAGTVSDGTAITVQKPGTDKGFLRVELSVSPITPANN